MVYGEKLLMSSESFDQKLQFLQNTFLEKKTL